MKVLGLLSLMVLINSCGISYKAITYNIRYDAPSDGPDRWENRKLGLAAQIKKLNPDFIGMQEALHHQVTYLDSLLRDYQYYGIGRDDGKKAGEYSPIFFKQDKYRVIEQGTFWLSPTPDRVSVGWDAALERICSYVKLKPLNSEAIWIFNTHFDHRGVNARKESAELIIAKIDELVNDERIILMGDFNLKSSEVSIQNLGRYFYSDGYKSPTGVKNSTFNGFDLNYNNQNIIDHIFGNETGLELKKYNIIDNRGGHSFLSDHLPVQAIFKVKN